MMVVVEKARRFEEGGAANANNSPTNRRVKTLAQTLFDRKMRRRCFQVALAASSTQLMQCAVQDMLENEKRHTFFLVVKFSIVQCYNSLFFDVMISAAFAYHNQLPTSITEKTVSKT